jgi:hypothetical protein
MEPVVAAADGDTEGGESEPAGPSGSESEPPAKAVRAEG